MQQKCTLFPERLADLREKANLTRQQLADILGISRASLEYYEKGKRTPDIDVLYKLSEYFNVTADYLIGRTNKSGQSTDVNAVSEFVGLSPFAVEHLNYYAATYEFCIDFLGDDLYNDKTKKLGQIYLTVLNDLILCSDDFHKITKQIFDCVCLLKKIENQKKETEINGWCDGFTGEPLYSDEEELQKYKDEYDFLEYKISKNVHNAIKTIYLMSRGENNGND